MHSSTSRSSSTTRCSTDKIPTTSSTSRDKSSDSRSTLNSDSNPTISNQNSPPTTPKLQQKRASLDFSRSETQATQTVQFDDTSALATLAAYENQILTSGLSLENPENSEIDSSSSPFKKVGSGIKLDRRSTKSIDEELDEEDEKNDKSLRWTMTQEELLEEERIEELVKSRRNRDPRLVIFDYNDPEDPRNWSSSYKWYIALLAFSIEMWANVISSIYAPGVAALATEFGVSTVAARVPQAVYLYGFALGPVLLAPLSEDYGRFWTHIVSLIILALCQIPCALSQNLGLLIPFRFIAGFFAAATFNSVGIVSDLWSIEDQSWPTNTFAFAAEAGAVIGPVIGSYLFVAAGNSWRWLFGLSGIGTGFLLIIWLFTVRETRSGVLLTRRARKKQKETGDDTWFAQHERDRSQHTTSQLLRELVVRPLWMLVTEPIVSSFAIFDGFNYAIIYLFLEAFPLVYGPGGFDLGPDAQSLPFLGVLVGFFVGFCLFYFQRLYEIHAARKALEIELVESNEEAPAPATGASNKKLESEVPPEARLYWAMPAGVLFAISLFWFAWTTFPRVPVIVSVLAGGAFGISSHAIFIAVSAYTITSYGPYATSAVAGQSFVREAASGSITLVAEQMFVNLGNQWAASLLAFIAIPLAFIPFVLYAYGPQIRSSSRFAEEIAEALELEKKMSDEDEAEAIMLARKVASQKKREERRAKKEKERMEWEKAENFNVQEVEKKDVKSQKVEQKKAKKVEKEKEEKSG